MLRQQQQMIGTIYIRPMQYENIHFSFSKFHFLMLHLFTFEIKIASSDA